MGSSATVTLADSNYLAHFRSVPPPFLHFVSGHFPAGAVTQPHRHPCLALHGCLDGPLRLVTEEREHTLEAGEFCMIGRGIRHSWRNENTHTAATLCVIIDTAHPGPWPPASGVEECCRDLGHLVRGVHRFTIVGDAELHGCFWLAADHLTHHEPQDAIAVAGNLMALLGHIRGRLSGAADEPSSDLDPAKRIRRLLLSRVADRVTVGEIAREVGMSPTRAKQLFHAAFGCGIIAYFNKLKIAQAKRLLGDLSLSVQQVSDQLGFVSPNYFSRAFLRHTGETPTSFRAQERRSSRRRAAE